MNSTDYKNYVTLAKKELKQIEGHQIRICQYALKVVTIRHGGRSDGYYTIKDFSADINMPYKTLQNWIQIYRNVAMKLNKPITTTTEFEKSRKVNDALKNVRALNNAYNGTQGTRQEYKKEIPASVVQSMYDGLEDGTKPFIMEFTRVVAAAKHNLHILKKRDLSMIEDSHLVILMQILDQSSDIINNYLTAKKKRK